MARKVTATFDPSLLQYEEIDVIEALDYAVALGVTHTPAIVLDGELPFVSKPSEAPLRTAIEDRLQP